MSFKDSKRLFHQAQQVLVGGVNSPVRSFRGVGGDPLVMKQGKGAFFFDEDNNRYADYCLSWGALILGHAHKDVVAAVKKAIKGGSSFGTTTRPEIEIAKHIVKCVPSMDMVRFVNSGTEATMSAIRLARGFTKRELVAKFDGGYHGHFDDLLVTAGSGVAHLKKSSSRGITKSHVQNTLSLPFNDIAVLEKTLDKHRRQIACVILEPVAGNMGVIPARKKFLQRLRQLTRKHGIVLIFDEIMTGFRSSAGGVQSDMGITPDMTCLGKIIGGGFPVGAYGGRKDIMRHLSPLGGVYQAGTFSGNPVVMSAGLATLKNLDRTFYRDLRKKSDRFIRTVTRFFWDNAVPVHLSHYHAMISIRFRPEAVFNYEDALKASSRKLYGGLFRRLLKAGIYLPPADLEAFFISGAHGERELDRLAVEIKKFFI
jgi:glutamate-1-semialdehyde 2,1-aminomutase